MFGPLFLQARECGSFSRTLAHAILFSNYTVLSVFCTAHCWGWNKADFSAPNNVFWANILSAAETGWLLISNFVLLVSFHLQMLQPYAQSGKPRLNYSSVCYRPSRGETDRLAQQPGSLTDGPDWGEGAARSHAVRERLTSSQFTWKATTSFPQFGTSAPPQAGMHKCMRCDALSGELRVKAPLALGSGCRHTLT